ncbi:hypothetical protein WA026_023371 [Henosepilachna vigintioctopunctata]|uniref:Uncharacterized protein n=1 Tax=Henosepilachna vigintioctopunctata TaxID=420089 RepID=A0AAW1V261_9CUCU
MAAFNSEADIPQWKKHLIARLRQNKCIGNGNSVVTVSTGRQLSPLFHGNSSGRVPKLYSQTSTEIPSSSSPACNQLSSTSSATELATNTTFSGRNGTSVLSDNKCCSPLTQRKIKSKKMVQERTWTVDYASCESVDTVSENDNYSRTSDSDSSEELHYGPGIVNKLRNKYLSLALRRENYNRPSILNLRKATSLENMLDDDDDEVSAKESDQLRIFQTNGTDKHSSNRYRNGRRGVQDMKRARSVEAISRFENMISPPPRLENARPKSLHEYILIGDKQEGNDKSYRKPKDSKAIEIETNIENSLFSSNYVPRINRPKRIAPVMNEREKPPADVVKQAKMIFERRPEQRTKPPVSTGEVAAKVASYKNIIVQSKPLKKPPIKIKPSIEKTVTNGKSNQVQNVKIEVADNARENKNDSETNGKFVNLCQSDAPKITPRIRESLKKDTEKLSPPKVDNIVEEKNTLEELIEPDNVLEKVDDFEVSNKSKNMPSPIPDISIIEFPKFDNEISRRLCETPDLLMTANPINASTPNCDKTATEEDAPSYEESAPNPNAWRKSDEPIESKISESVTPNCCDSNRGRSPVIETSSNENVPFNEPLKLIINGNQNRSSPSPEASTRFAHSSVSPLSRRKIVSPPIRPQKDSPLFDRVTEKNLINAAKSLEQEPKLVVGVKIGGKAEEKTDVIVPKRVRRPPREPESNSIVFKFTDRKDVPDYVQNDRSRTAARLEKPKVRF